MSDFMYLTPPSASAHERAIEIVMAERLDGIDAPIARLWNVDTCPVELLPWMAWALSVELWEHTWPDTIKRDVIRQSVKVHRIKGTLASVKSALQSLGYSSDISEWFQYGGASHTFRVNVLVPNGAPFDLTSRAKVCRSVDAVKPVRSHYDLDFTVKVGAPLRVGAHARMGGVVRTLALLPINQKEAVRSVNAATSGRGGVHHTKGLHAA